MLAAEFLEQRYPTPRARLRAQWKKEMEQDCDRRAGAGNAVQPAAMAGLME